MSGSDFNRDEFAEWYATRHLRTDRGIQTVYYLPASAPAKEIRLLEVNEVMAERPDDSLEPLDFGVDIANVDGHRLMVLDVTPSQWRRITQNQIPLPSSWSLEGAVSYCQERR